MRRDSEREMSEWSSYLARRTCLTVCLILLELHNHPTKVLLFWLIGEGIRDRELAQGHRATKLQSWGLSVFVLIQSPQMSRAHDYVKILVLNDIDLNVISSRNEKV